VGKVRLVDTGKGSFFGDCLYEQVLDRDDFGGVAAAVGLSRPGARGYAKSGHLGLSGGRLGPHSNLRGGSNGI